MTTSPPSPFASPVHQLLPHPLTTPLCSPPLLLRYVHFLFLSVNVDCSVDREWRAESGVLHQEARGSWWWAHLRLPVWVLWVSLSVFCWNLCEVWMLFCLSFTDKFECCLSFMGKFGCSFVWVLWVSLNVILSFMGKFECCFVWVLWESLLFCLVLGKASLPGLLNRAEWNRLCFALVLREDLNELFACKVKGKGKILKEERNRDGVNNYWAVTARFNAVEGENAKNAGQV